ncbi:MULTISPECIES: hypothetical protein [Planktothricoides]|uniref:Uncharacterized protein n=1 Tax=Planktothricoides raciborskii FACHB-1370 TaxID=2949576 RepID=A0ABR8EJ99_9CYAN|nr:MULTISPECIES: hypothetical protein [Planktothricoides]KOR34740.1 hypothetical protein AM228_22165 [Planktothricoides sp. SR001]MBD2546971.1 hypothetical protein [Planktothricoides raciborskii FACHB-1370]MBD2585488.1 hypothetical protein [Planktothricoides raciborskii FACHB-1261]
MDLQQQDMPLVYAPNLHLFAFHLWRGLTGKPDSRATNPHLLWQKGDEILASLGFTERLDIYGYPESSPEPGGMEVNLNKQPLKLIGKLPEKVANQELGITGRVLAHRLHDSYSLTLNFRRPETENDVITAAVPVSFWRVLNTDNSVFLPDFVQSSLGQTLLLTAFLPPEEQDKYNKNSDNNSNKYRWVESLKPLAQKCLKQLIPASRKQPPLERVGELFGSPIFEFGGQVIDADFSPESLDTCHVLIWLFREDSASEKFVAAYRQFINLFYYRNKVLSAYRESRSLYRQLYDNYIQLEEKVKALKDLLKLQQQSPGQRVSDGDLNQLRHILEDLSSSDLEYARLLRNYKHSRNTIAINGKNYQVALGAIQYQLEKEKNYVVPESDLDFFREFSDRTCPYFQTRIADELNYFVEGSSLADKAVASIRGIVEIEQTQRDRQLQDQEKSLENTIQALGLALGTGAIVASSSGLITASWNKERSDYPHPFIIALLASFSVAICVYWLVKFWQWLSQPKSK